MKKIKKSSWTMCHQKRGQIGGRDSLGDCDNICEGNLVFRVIFGKFMHRWFQICAQLGSFNVFFSHHRPPKLKYCFFRGSFSQPTSKSKWVGEPDYIISDNYDGGTVMFIYHGGTIKMVGCENQTYYIHLKSSSLGSPQLTSLSPHEKAEVNII